MITRARPFAPASAPPSARLCGGAAMPAALHPSPPFRRQAMQLETQLQRVCDQAEKLDAWIAQALAPSCS